MLVTVSERDCVLPTVTLPKLRVVGFDRRVPCVTPVPDMGTVSIGLEAVDVMVTLPPESAALSGVNVTVKVVL